MLQKFVVCSCVCFHCCLKRGLIRLDGWAVCLYYKAPTGTLDCTVYTPFSICFLSTFLMKIHRVYLNLSKKGIAFSSKSTKCNTRGGKLHLIPNCFKNQIVNGFHKSKWCDRLL